MLPDKYVDGVKRHRKNRYLIKHLTISFLLLGSMYIFGPLIHEASHVLWLEAVNCYYTSQINFNFLIGFNGAIQPLCHLGKSSSIIFYSAGYASTILAGMTLILVGDIGDKIDDYLIAAGVGMLLSALMTVNLKGDLANLVSVLGLSELNFMAVSTFITLGLLGTSVKAVEILVESLEREEGSTD